MFVAERPRFHESLIKHTGSQIPPTTATCVKRERREKQSKPMGMWQTDNAKLD